MILLLKHVKYAAYQIGQRLNYSSSLYLTQRNVSKVT